MDRARLESLRAEHQPVPLTSLDDGYHCGKCCGYNWPCEQSQILDLALEAIAELDTIIDALTLTDALQAKLEQAEQALVAAESMAVLFGNVPLKSHWGIARDKAIEAYRAALEETR